MSALYHSYEQELTALLTSLKARQQSNPDDRFSEDLREAESLVTQLEIEARAGGAGQEIRNRIQGFKDDVRHLRERHTLLSGGGSGGNTGGGRGGTASSRGGAMSGRDARLLDDEEALDRSSENLLNSRRTLLETESLATSISQDLLSNRTTIMSTREKLLHTGGLLGKAHRTMRSMQSREVQRKMCVYGAVGFVCLMFLIFTARVLFPGSHNPVPASPPTTEAPTASPTIIPTSV